MIRLIVLDAGPLGLLTNPKVTPETLDATRWSLHLMRAGCRLIVPAVADYEVRRELLRAGKIRSIRLLDVFNAAEPDRFVELTQNDLKLAAEFWAQSRRAGSPTGDPKELDCDALIAAQASALLKPTRSVVVATTNVGHLSQFVPAQFWSSIEP